MNTAAPDTAAAPVTPARPRPVARPGLENRARLLLRPWWPATGEVLVSLVTALGFTYWGLSVGNSPVTRVGQVSGLSDLQFRLALLLLVLLAAVGWATVRGGERVRSLAVRLGAAAVAGLSTGFLGAGQVFALRGTPWPINGPYGDNNRTWPGPRKCCTPARCTPSTRRPCPTSWGSPPRPASSAGSRPSD
ncbi:hypothetical protein AB0907_11630 [Streptomyces sp. NPDC006975]|uniref:hypothetical protein n=1 Tax=unclassified Streptomyces TaxID=2593676 RepID=UPI0034539579